MDLEKAQQVAIEAAKLAGKEVYSAFYAPKKIDEKDDG